MSIALPNATPADGAPVRTVDVHAHVILPRVEQAVAGQPGLDAHRELDARRNGPESLAVSGRMVGERVPRLTRVPARLADMDAAGVDVQIVSPSPSHYHYWAGEELAEQVCRLAGEGVAEHCAQAPDRLHGLGLVPLQHPPLMVRLLDHALGLGLKGVEISSHAPGRELSDRAYEPFWAHAARTGAVVFLHPFGCTLDERLDRFYLSNIVGQPAENAVALSHLIFSGVLDRHPALKVLAAHGGGYLPTYLGRADHGWRVRPEARGCAEPPSAYLRRVWFDSLVYEPAALRALVEVAGPSRVVLGSDHPFDMGVTDPVDRLRAAGLDPDAFDAIRGRNAAALFDL
ncbi:aminocarboxymuconate-semialdehyde decarboxylase [Streptosporangium becharense]|uniref:Aminocarboxymuconate-semialdehyde decarboxylase n=1 Tax=Streptosporangium becharense TaxID=1816182 RepID=A0A7W9MDV0_9ACTN|nr:amidohydrolase family protein [Streptosporangium becharense]MBB2914245.1 aminocarboxymuconate-semialdehyde decarboxylase [Streptosporangium becharense]MBB5817272.1 aminocarboxymuconate-semialdehyde decarboxylase [Streptosporangium becharense]